ncbi:hypothetical protein RUM43_005345 [Polyplax serrata]|uniref:Cobalamin adenosyltransferase-like domain-containing protein n=1 Tax=Polyplax serrata TaxID=468196 RepID=A0AAN8NWK1_POLSC
MSKMNLTWTTTLRKQENKFSCIRSDKNPFFTKLGDNGKSKVEHGLMDKDNIIFEAIGATEELNAFIGFAREFVQEDEKLIPIADKLRKIQLVLIDAVDIVNSIPPKAAPLKGKTLREPTSVAKITSGDISELEALIAHYGTLLPQVERFIVPGGGKASTALRVAKEVCRRCERAMVTVFKDVGGDKNILIYINRLSSYLSQAARVSAKFANRPESIYKPPIKDPNIANQS